jgi:hydroxymethylpyrimidine/phosphomethylpyrimidine kinase
MHLAVQLINRRSYSVCMSKLRELPITLTIAGSDSGGGAGIQADLKTFAALGVHGTSVITCLTAQNPKQVLAIEPCKPALVRAQLSAVFAELPPRAIKTGMLFTSGIIGEVVQFFAQVDRMPPLIVDPVMVATSGSRLVEAKAIKLMKEALLPIAMLVTPNLSEAQMLSGMTIRGPEDLRKAARLIRREFGCAVLIKGGHLTAVKSALDLFYDGETELLFSAPFIKGISTHGTGCTYSAAIAGYCAMGYELTAAVHRAKQFITQAIGQSYRAAKHPTLNSFWKKHVRVKK